MALPMSMGRTSYCKSKFMKFIRQFTQIVIVRKKSTAIHETLTVPSVESKSSRWESVVGLEVHAQITAKSKLFSGAGTTFLAPVNSQVSYFDAALPGTLPVLNRRCVEAAVLTALALNCKINKVSLFDRKHYFYADLPAGYQITQQRRPIAKDGCLPFIVYKCTPQPYKLEARIQQIQLEQDSGKSLHDTENNRSLIDLNRAGIALMELVFDASLKNGEEAAALIEELQLVLQCLGTCDGKMEEGSLRVDANVSVNRPGEPWGTRTEIKNINSDRSVAKAIDYEIARQIDELESGGTIVNETRTFDAKLRCTIAMRDKENQQDYRFMPEPNLPPLRLQDEGENIPGAVSIAEIRKRLPVLPEQKRQDVTKRYGLAVDVTQRLIRDPVLLNYIEKMASVPSRNPKAIVNLVLNDVLALLNEAGMSISVFPVSPERLGELLDLRANKVISEAIKKEILLTMFKGDIRNPSEIVEANGWQQISDETQVLKMCQNVLTENPKLVKAYKSGKTKVFSRLTQLLRSEKRLDMALATKLLKELLDK